MASIPNASSLKARLAKSGASSKQNNITDIGLLSKRPDPLLSTGWYIKVMPKSAASYHVDHTYVETIDLPFNEIKSGAHFAGGGYNYFPEFHDISAFSVNFYADSEARVLSWIVNWRSKVKDFGSGLYGMPSEYKDSMTVALMTVTQKVIATVELQGIWPASISNLDLNNDTPNKLVLAVTFSVDGQSIKII